MNARIRATGEIINVERYGDAYAEVLPSCSERSYPEVYEFDELEFITEPDWQQVRIQAAIAAMQAELSNSKNTFMVCEDKKAIIARRSVRYADALIAELKK